MKRLRLAAVLTGVGALVVCPGVRASVLPDPGSDGSTAVQRSSPGLALLETAARVAVSHAWSATQRVITVSNGASQVVVAPTGHGAAGGGVDEQLFGLLSSNYDVTIGPTTVCQGRPARLVEVRRPGADGAAAVAGRFWIDMATGLVLRRDVMDLKGSVLRRVEILGLHLGPPATAPVSDAAAPHGERLDAVGLAAMEQQGWPVPRSLPEGLELYDARWLDGEVLQLAYSDGLSTLSLFVQQGEVTPHATGIVRQVAGGPVWEAPGEPERVVWASGGHTWTLVSEADPALVDEVLAELPHTTHEITQDGLVPRIWRGLCRVGAWLNPFE